MSVPDEQPVSEPAAAEPVAETPKTSRRLGPFLTAAAALAAIGVTAVVHVLGGAAWIVFAVIGGAAAGGVVLWRLPQLRKHFASPRRGFRSRARSFRSGGRLSGGGRRGSAAGKGFLPKLGSRGRSGAATRGRLGQLFRGRSPGAAGRGGLGRLFHGGRTGHGPFSRRGLLRRLSGRGGRGAAGHGRGGSRFRRLLRRKPQAGGAAKRPSGSPVRRGLAAAWKRARKAAGGSTRSNGTARPFWQRAAGFAAVAVLFPFIGAAAAAKALRGRRKRREADGQEAAGSEPAAELPPAPEPEKPVRRPNPRPPTVPGGGSPSHQGGPLSDGMDATADAIKTHIGGFRPTSGPELDRFLYRLHEIYGTLAESLAALAERFASDLPVDPTVHHHIRELAATTGGCDEYAQQTYRIHRTAHKREMRRIEDPRPNEDVWDKRS